MKKYCSNCGFPMKNEGTFCERCGKPLDDINTSSIPSQTNSKIENNLRNVIYHKNKYIALFLSIIPGWGQMYNGQILKGIIFPTLMTVFLILSTSYENNDIISVPSFILFMSIYFYNLGDAYKTANDISNDNGNYFYSHESEASSGFYENKMNDFQKLDSQISSYFHEKAPNGEKRVSLIKVAILIFVLFILLNLLSAICP